MALRAAATVSPGDTATATQYNNSLRDAIYLGGDFATTGGSANAQTLALSAQVTTLENGMKIRAIAGLTNTSSMNINVNGIGAVLVKDEFGAVLTGGELVANSPFEMTYNGGYFYLRRSEISGITKIWLTPTAPSGYLLMDGSAISRTTYAILFALLNRTLGTVTITIASPGVVTLTAHGLATGDSIYLTTSGALPTGLSANTQYWVIKNDANSFWLATSLVNAVAGTKINTSGSQSGTHTATFTFGVGDGSTTFNLPNFKGKIPVMLDQSVSDFAGLGQTGGVSSVTLTGAQSGVPAHAHPFQFATGSGSGVAGIFSATGGTTTTSNAGGPAAAGTTVTNNTAADAASAHTNLQPYITVYFIIKT